MPIFYAHSTVGTFLMKLIEHSDECYVMQKRMHHTNTLPKMKIVKNIQ